MHKEKPRLVQHDKRKRQTPQKGSTPVAVFSGGWVEDCKLRYTEANDEWMRAEASMPRHIADSLYAEMLDKQREYETAKSSNGALTNGGGK